MNILVNSDGEVLSIDEGDIYGKRTKIFNKSDWFLKKEVVEKTRAMATEIVEEWKLDDKVELQDGWRVGTLGVWVECGRNEGEVWEVWDYC